MKGFYSIKVVIILEKRFHTHNQGRNFVHRYSELYQFLRYCNSSSLSKEVLDLGAGGGDPPLYLFYKYGFLTKGIEIDDYYLNLALEFSRAKEIDLNITKGDMRDIPFDDNSISFIYSINTIFHMMKADIEVAMNEIYRILRPCGLCFINFVSVDADYYGEGVNLGHGLWEQDERKGNEIIKVIHSFYKDSEPDKYYTQFEIIRKEKRITLMPYKDAYLYYIAKKQ